MKKSVVFCGSSTQISPVYHSEMEILAKGLVEKGRQIVYGGARLGLMGTLADTALTHNGYVVGIVPECLNQAHIVHGCLTELHIVNDLLDRKKLMLENSQEAIIFPGGIGTLDEAFEVLALKQLDLYSGQIYFLNFLNFWEPLLNYMEELVLAGTIPHKTEDVYTICDSSKELLDVIVG